MFTITLNFTFLIYALATIALSFLFNRTLKIHRQQGTRFSKFFLYGNGAILFFFFLITIVSLFFATPSFLRITAILSIFLQSLAVMFFNEAFFPQIFTGASSVLKLIQSAIIFLTLIAIALYYFSGESPLLNPQGFIDWNISYLVGALRALIIISFIIPAIIIFSRQLRSESRKEIRRKSVLFIIFFGICIFFAVPLVTILKVSGLSELLGISVIVLITSAIIFLTKKSGEIKEYT